MQTIVKITGMSCGHCVMGVKNALKGLPGVTNLDVIIGQTTIESEAGLDPKLIKETIEEEGYEVVAVS